MSQTEEEKALIAKWNAGDYSADGWVNNTDGLTDEALKGLAEYNAKDFGGEISEEDLAGDIPPGEFPDVLEDIDLGQIAPAPIKIWTIRLGPRYIVFAVVYQRFAPGFGTFRAAFTDARGAGRADLTGEVVWDAQRVSPERTYTVITTLADRVILASGIIPIFRIRFVSLPTPFKIDKLTGLGSFAP